MNMILVESGDFVNDRRVHLSGRRARHIVGVHRARIGADLRVGLLGGKMGIGKVISVGDASVEMDVFLAEDPPPPVPVTLLLAMPRPKCFRRLLQSIVTMGVKRVAIFGAYRVEKSYWETPLLSPDVLRDEMILGLEQGRDTGLPVVTLHPHFKPFVEDVLPSLTHGARCLAAHPGMGNPCPMAITGPVALAVGPEGGFTSYEADRLKEFGFELVSLGTRILRTEQVVPYLMGRILPLSLETKGDDSVSLTGIT